MCVHAAAPKGRDCSLYLVPAFRRQFGFLFYFIFISRVVDIVDIFKDPPKNVADGSDAGVYSLGPQGDNSTLGQHNGVGRSVRCILQVFMFAFWGAN